MSFCFASCIQDFKVFVGCPAVQFPSVLVAVRIDPVGMMDVKVANVDGSVT